MNKHGVSRKSFTEANVKDFKSVALRTTTNITRTGLELKCILILKCDLFLHYCDSKEISLYYLHIQNFVQNTKNM